jgi:hypothetical protein
VEQNVPVPCPNVLKLQFPVSKGVAMRIDRWMIGALLAVVAMSIVAFAQIEEDRPANDQPPAAGTVLRYQISAYAGTGSGGSVHHGCYIVDTQTGEVWHTRTGGTAEKVSGRLP